IMNIPIAFLPLKNYTNIVEGNALRLDWRYLHNPSAPDRTAIYAEKVNLMRVGEPTVHYGTIDLYTKELVQNEPEIPKLQEVHYDYIMGNPPFVGYGMQSERQKEDILLIYRDENGKHYKTAGKIDYVSAWYFKAAQFIQGKKTECAFVSTNSITQGEQVASVWKPVFERFCVQFDFAYKTFRWDSESTSKAHVHCVIIGFSCCGTEKSVVQKEKVIYDSDGNRQIVKNINSYLCDADNIFLESRPKPICDVPYMTTGNRPADGGHLIIESEEYDEFVNKEPGAVKFIKKLTGAEEFINNKKRYCLWLVGADPAEIMKMPEVYKRVQLCRQDRLKGAPDRQKLADTPTIFREIKNPEHYIVVPATSSEKRKYIPLGFMDDTTIPTNSAVIIPNAALYEFGILTSSVHMAWMRAVCGRLEMRYRYSKDIVYNNFPWPTPNDEPKKRIEQTAQVILGARAKYPNSSLADLYDEATMPQDLRKAHQENDKAVMKAYGFPIKMTESECVAELFKLYQKLVSKKK
ncbi:MAG: hypothetical protein Q4F84_08225, partial [Fibrobacter sp.]|nr:hypothetical protein [Fibrobacter sp.]